MAVGQDKNGLHLVTAAAGDEGERDAEEENDESEHAGDGEGAVKGHFLAVAVLLGEEGFGVAVVFGEQRGGVFAR